MPMDTPDTSSPEMFFMGVVIGAALCIFVVLMLVIASGTCTERTWQDRAVKAGKAEYYLDADNVRQWRWK